MIEIRPHALYSRSDLALMLEGTGVNVDTFIGRLKPRKVFKMLFYGKDLLTALDQAPALAEPKQLVKTPAARNVRNRQQRKQGEGSRPAQPGSRLIQEFQKSGSESDVSETR